MIETHLFVDGVALKAQAGDFVGVPAEAIGQYQAPTYARLLANYGLSKGEPSKSLSYKKEKNCEAGVLLVLPVS